MSPTIFTYHPNGDRTTKSTLGVTPVYGDDAAGQLLTDGAITYAYDANGNLINAGADSYVWDRLPDNRNLHSRWSP